jgi:transposase
MGIHTLGMDIGKNVFHLHGVDVQGHSVLSKRFSRAAVLRFLAQLPPCVIGMEACAGSHYLARRVATFGHEVRLVAPQFVKPYIKSNKNDYRDAEAICEAITRPHMRFVHPKSREQQDLQALHRVRQGYLKRRTATVNQIRAFLLENGLTVPEGLCHLRRRLPDILRDETTDLSGRMRSLLEELWQQVQHLDQKLKQLDDELDVLAAEHPLCQRLMSIPGVAHIVATAFIAQVGDASTFRNGRELAAWFGLVPRQRTTGGKPTLLGISKRGDRYVRTLLVHGARAILRFAKDKPDPHSQWIQALRQRKKSPVVAVAVANKTVRIAWALLTRQTRFNATAA